MMARNYAPLHSSIWKPSDFRDLDPLAQYIYIMLFSQPDISSCGLLTYNPTKLAKHAKDLTVSDVEDAVARLEATAFIVVDREECELLVRTYIKWDNAYGNGRRLEGIRKAIGVVSSMLLRSALKTECERLSLPFDDLFESVPSHLEGPSKTHSRAIEVQDDASSKASGTGIGNGSGNGIGLETRAKKNQAPGETDPLFVRFWKAFPRSAGRKAAWESWRKAAKRQDPEVIIAAAERYAADPNLPEEVMIPHGATWLNQDRWDDPPCPPRSAGKPTQDENVASWESLKSESRPRAVES